MPRIPGIGSRQAISAFRKIGYEIDRQKGSHMILFRAATPKLGEAHNNLAVVLMLTKRYPEATEELKAAEAAGFKVNPQFKEDLKKALAAR